MKKAIVAFALQEEVVPVSIPGFEVHTILTKITKVQAAFRLTKAIFELQPDFVLNVGTAGTLTYTPAIIAINCRRSSLERYFYC